MAIDIDDGYFSKYSTIDDVHDALGRSVPKIIS
jgi:hypothetical protein